MFEGRKVRTEDVARIRQNRENGKPDNYQIVDRNHVAKKKGARVSVNAGFGGWDPIVPRDKWTHERSMIKPDESPAEDANADSEDASDDANVDINMNPQTEEEYRETAKALGIKNYHNTGLDKLKTKVDKALAEMPDASDDEDADADSDDEDDAEGEDS